MLKVSYWLFFILFCMSLLIVPSVNFPIIQANASSTQSQVDPGNFTVTVITSTIHDVTYTKQKILFIGESIVTDSLTFINCSVIFSNINDIYNSSGLILNNGASLSIINSNVSYINSNELFFISGLGENDITLANSTITSNLNSPEPTMNFFNSKSIFVSNCIFFNSLNLFKIQYAQKIIFLNSHFFNNTANTIIASNIVECNFTNNSFELYPNFLNKTISFNSIFILKLSNNFVYSFNSLDSGKGPKIYPLFITNSISVYLSSNTFSKISDIIYLNGCSNVIFNGNILTDFNTGLFFNSNARNILIYQNNFINGLNSFIFENSRSEVTFNITLNNFFNISQVLTFYNSNSAQPLTGSNVSYNYYSKFKGIDFNNDGFFDSSYTSNYFIDNHPLSYPFENYFILKTGIFLDSNYREASLLHSTSSFHLFNANWSFLIIYYIVVTLFPIILFLFFKKKKLTSSNQSS